MHKYLVVSDLKFHLELLLQRRIVDFAADVPFHDVPKKLLEHYGFELSSETVRKTTLQHANRASQCLPLEDVPSTGPGVKQLLAELDGGMIPIVTVDNMASGDKRKTRKVCWKEARLCFSRDVDSVTGHFRATLGSIDETGDQWLSSAVSSGIGSSTQVHCVGDGATWIKEQADRIFGSNGSYLVDFYHVSDYLAASAPFFDKENPRKWMREQQSLLKSGHLYRVLQELENNLYWSGVPEQEPVRACYRYLCNRLDQLDYLGAILSGLPIGSGEIESAHRYVVQKRMKRAGAWWKEENAEPMLQLMILRVNGLWDAYWALQKSEAYKEAA